MAVVLCPVTIAAQTLLGPPRDYSFLSVPEDFTTRLQATQYKLEGSYLDRYAVRVRAGQVLIFSVESSEFDPKLIIGEYLGSVRREDDDGGGGTTALIAERFEDDTTIVVGVYSYGAEQSGTYRIRISEPRQMVETGAWSGILSPSDVVLYDGTYADYTWFDARAGERIVVRMQSTDFDAYLRIRDADGDEVARDDDSAGGTDAQIEFDVPVTGRYHIEMSSLDEAEGTYRLTMARVQRMPVAATTAATAIDIGQRVNGEITAADSRDCGAEARCDHYTFAATAGERLTITMVSETDALDPVVILLDPNRDEVGRNDDDPNNGRHSRLDFTAPTTGRHHIIARSYSAGGAGRYVLSVQRRP